LTAGWRRRASAESARRSASRAAMKDIPASCFSPSGSAGRLGVRALDYLLNVDRRKTGRKNGGFVRSDEVRRGRRRRRRQELCDVSCNRPSLISCVVGETAAGPSDHNLWVRLL
jgi:hypothetical protein